MSCLAVLQDADGRPLLGLQVLCRGVPCTAESTGRTNNNVRFVSRAAGDFSFVLSNGGPWLVHFDLQKASLTPGQDWGDAPASSVNRVTLVDRGSSCSVERDESTGCAMLAKPMRDADGKPVREVHAELRGLARTKWRLKVRPGIPEPLYGCGPCGVDYKTVFEDFKNFQLSSWVLVDGGQDDIDVELMTVTSPTASTLMTVSPTATVADLREKIESALGIPRAEQRLLSYDGRQLKDEDALAATKLDETYARVYVCGAKPQPGDHVWVHVEVMTSGSSSREPHFYVGRSTDHVRDVRKRVPWPFRYGEGTEGTALPDHHLFLGDVELADDGRSLADYGVLAGSTLTVRHRGSTLLTVVLPGPNGEERVKVWADLGETVSALRDKVGRAICGRSDAITALSVDGVELDAALTLAEARVTPETTFHARLGLRKFFVQAIRAGIIMRFVCPGDESTEVIKEWIHKREGIDPSDQRLFFGSQRMCHSFSLADGSLVDLYLALGGETSDYHLMEDALRRAAVASVLAPAVGGDNYHYRHDHNDVGSDSVRELEFDIFVHS